MVWQNMDDDCVDICKNKQCKTPTKCDPDLQVTCERTYDVGTYYDRCESQCTVLACGSDFMEDTECVSNCVRYKDELSRPTTINHDPDERKCIKYKLKVRKQTIKCENKCDGDKNSNQCVQKGYSYKHFR